MRQDQERIKNLLIDTVTLLCKNSVQFQDELHVEGLLGVSVDKRDVFFVHISKEFSNSPSSGATVTQSHADREENESNAIDTPAATDSPRASNQQDHRDNTCDVNRTNQRPIKTETVEPEEECLIVEDPHIKLEGKVMPAQTIAGQRRAVKRTSNIDSQQYSSDSSISGGYGVSGDHFDNSQFGEPVIKKRVEDTAHDRYLQGDSEDQGGTPWPSLTGSAGFDPSQAFQQDSDSSQISMSMDSSQPGCSSWATAGGGVSESVDNDFKLAASAGGLFTNTSSLPQSVGKKTGDEYPCPVCGKVFTARALLERHNRIHTGERPFTCSQCLKAFTRKDHMIRHLQNMHGFPKDRRASVYWEELANAKI